MTGYADGLPVGDSSTWRRASFCQANGCIEVAPTEGGVAVRDTKGGAPVLRFTTEEFRAFVAGVKVGEFDDLCR